MRHFFNLSCGLLLLSSLGACSSPEEAKQKQREASRGNPTRFKPSNAYIKDGVTYLGSIEASIKTNIPRTTLMKHAKFNKNGWASYSLINRE